MKMRMRMPGSSNTPVKVIDHGDLFEYEQL